MIALSWNKKHTQVLQDQSNVETSGMKKSLEYQYVSTKQRVRKLNVAEPSLEERASTRVDVIFRLVKTR